MLRSAKLSMIGKNWTSKVLRPHLKDDLLCQTFTSEWQFWWMRPSDNRSGKRVQVVPFQMYHCQRLSILMLCQPNLHLFHVQCLHIQVNIYTHLQKYRKQTWSTHIPRKSSLVATEQFFLLLGFFFSLCYMQPQAGLHNHHHSLILPAPKLSRCCWDKIWILLFQLKESIIYFIEENLYPPYLYMGCKLRSFSEDYMISFYLIYF